MNTKMHESYDDWVGLAEKMSRAVRLEPETAEENIMACVMAALGGILKSFPDATRIWTLHKIAGNQVRFHRSNFRPRDQDPKKVAMPISNGLIGVALVDDRDVKSFCNVSDDNRFVPGWEDCLSEVIALVRNTQGKAIGVINIESNISHDFITDTSNINHIELGFDSKESFDEYVETERSSLEKILKIASNQLSRIFQNQSQSQLNQSATQLIENVSRDSVVTVDVLNSTVESIYYWLKDVFDIQKSVFYISDSYDTESEKFMYSHMAQYVDYFIEKGDIPSKICIEKSRIEDSFINPVECSKRRMESIFGAKVTKSIFNKDDDIVYLHAPCSTGEAIGFEYVSILTFNSSSRVSLTDITRYSNIINNIYERYIYNSRRRYENLINETITGIYKTSLEIGDVRTNLDKVATQIAEKTGGLFCLIYMTAEEYHQHSQYNFYLSGAGKGYVNFADRRFEQEVGIIGHVLKSKRNFYSSDFYNDSLNMKLLDKSLQDHGLEKPELYAYPLIKKSTSASDVNPNGVVLLFRETKENRYSSRPDRRTVDGMLLEYSGYLSSIINVKVNHQANNTLRSSLGKFIAITDSIYRGRDIEDRLSIFVNSIQENILPSWSKVVSPLYMAVYKRVHNRFVMVDVNSSLQKKVGVAASPEFHLGKGLTGSVMYRENSELYEPFIEDYENYMEANDVNLTPDDACKIYWNDAIGDKRRMFYGKHVRVGIEDYVILLIGQRKQEFMPSIGYTVAKEFISAIEPVFVEVVKSDITNYTEDASYDEEINILRDIALGKGAGLTEEDQVEFRNILDNYIRKTGGSIDTDSGRKKVGQRVKDTLHDIAVVSKDMSGIHNFIEKLLSTF